MTFLPVARLPRRWVQKCAKLIRKPRDVMFITFDVDQNLLQ